ncbi:hemerythrin domain-containing protein [Streptomyces sp. NPDC059788]|uniref:hemerythrin domain-containing protein n=1 Tax=Streptomyces sp. NPDC059788 TaxID=3346948 RepID=UPI003668CE68
MTQWPEAPAGDDHRKKELVKSRERITAWNRELQSVHHRLEKALEEARDAIRNGTRTQTLSPDLRSFCYNFCSALGQHHRSEDAEFFPTLLEQMPELEPAITSLTQHHQVLAQLLDDFQKSLDSAESSPRRLLKQINTIKSVMKTHFSAEERSLNYALRVLDAPTSDSVRMFGDIR